MRKDFNLDHLYLPAEKEKYCWHGEVRVHNSQYIKKSYLVKQGITARYHTCTFIKWHPQETVNVVNYLLGLVEYIFRTKTQYRATSD